MVACRPDLELRSVIGLVRNILKYFLKIFSKYLAVKTRFTKPDFTEMSICSLRFIAGFNLPPTEVNYAICIIACDLIANTPFECQKRAAW